jgi:hypothetical protein
MNTHLLQIPAYLKKANFGGNNHGLLHGDTGIVLFLYHLSRATKNAETEEMADNLLDKIFAGISTTAPADFENGLAGIGWGIEYLVQHGFAEGNTDDILEEVDTRIFKTICDDNQPTLELTNGLTGYLVYLNARLKNTNNPESMAQRINRELLIHTVNKIDEAAPANFPNLVKEHYFDLYWRFPAMLFALAETYQSGLYNHKIVLMLKQWVMYFNAYIPSLHINRLYLAVALHRINRFMHNTEIEKQIRILLFAVDFDEIITEFDHQHHGIRFGVPGALWVVHQALQNLPQQSVNYRKIRQLYTKLKTGFMSNQNLMFQNSQINKPGISDGLSGIGLMQLLWTEIFVVKMETTKSR